MCVTKARECNDEAAMSPVYNIINEVSDTCTDGPLNGLVLERAFPGRSLRPCNAVGPCNTLKPRFF